MRSLILLCLPLLAGCSFPIKLVNENVIYLEADKSPAVETNDTSNVPNVIVNVPKSAPVTRSQPVSPPPPRRAVPTPPALPDLPSLEDLSPRERQLVLVEHIGEIRELYLNYSKRIRRFNTQ